MVKIKLTKILITLCLIVVVAQVFMPYTAYAANSITEKQSELFQVSLDYGGIGNLIDGIIGVLTVGARIKWTLIGAAIGAISTVVAVSDNFGDLADTKLVTPEDILFNRVTITDIDFFNINGAPEGSVTRTIREQVSLWYTVLRDIAIVILLCVLIYIGIRMALSTVAAEKAEYKKMLINWAVSFVLLFLLQYIAMFAIEVNKGLVNILESSIGSTADDAAGVDVNLAGVTVNVPDIWENYILDLASKAINPFSATEGWAAAIVYVGVGLLTIAFLYQYLMRMLTIAFLLLIAPLVTVTYSIDKIGDNKSQALNEWLRQLVYNILLQPFHCIIYMAFVSTAIKTLDTSGLAGLVVAVLCMMFILKAEDIVREIFAFKPGSSAIKTAMGLSFATAAFNRTSSFVNIAKTNVANGISSISGVSNKLGSNYSGGGSKGVASRAGTTRAARNSLAAVSLLGGAGRSSSAGSGGSSVSVSSSNDNTKDSGNNLENLTNQKAKDPSAFLDKYMQKQQKQFKNAGAAGVVGAVSSLMQGQIPGFNTRNSTRQAYKRYGNKNMNAAQIGDGLSAATGKNYKLDNDEGKKNYQELMAAIRRNPQEMLNGFFANMDRVKNNIQDKYESQGYNDAADRAQNDVEKLISKMGQMSPEQVENLNQDEKDLYESLMKLTLAGKMEDGEIVADEKEVYDVEKSKQFTPDPNSQNYMFEETLAGINEKEEKRKNTNTSATLADTETKSSNEIKGMKEDKPIQRPQLTSSDVEGETDLDRIGKDMDQSAQEIDKSAKSIDKTAKDAENAVDSIRNTSKEIERKSQEFQSKMELILRKQSAPSASSGNTTLKRSTYKLKTNTSMKTPTNLKQSNSEKIKRSMQIDQEARRQSQQINGGASQSGQNRGGSTKKGNIRTRNNPTTPPTRENKE